MYVKSQSAQRRPDGRRERRSTRLPLVFAATFCVAAFAIGCGGCTSSDTKKNQPATQLVSLEAANSPGSSPWMDSTTSADLPRKLNRVESTSTASPNTVSGDQVGLYGGSTNQAVCDRDKMVNFLERNPAQAAAWRTVTGASDIRAYANSLSPVVLTHDTRVTNHGFKDGAATAFQSVLQTGTAVMIDNRGMPRVRCDSGSPLSDPQGDVTEEYTGTGWQGLDTDSVVKVQRSETPIENLELVSIGEIDGEPAFAEMPFGDTQATPAPEIKLPPGATLVPIEITPPLTSVTSSTGATSSVTTPTPSTTPSTTTTSVSGTPSSTATSATSSVATTTGGAQNSSLPTAQQGTVLPTP